MAKKLRYQLQWASGQGPTPFTQTGDKIMTTNEMTASWTWRALELAALHDPTLQQIVTLVHRGDITRDQAAIGAALMLWQANARLRDTLIEEINSRMRPIIISAPEKS